jgi:hypothetical protein
LFISADAAGRHEGIEIAGVDQNLPPLSVSAWPVVRQTPFIAEHVDQRLGDTGMFGGFGNGQHGITAF